jgi:hypothetical protein
VQGVVSGAKNESGNVVRLTRTSDDLDAITTVTAPMIARRIPKRSRCCCR